MIMLKLNYTLIIYLEIWYDIKNIKITYYIINISEYIIIHTKG